MIVLVCYFVNLPPWRHLRSGDSNLYDALLRSLYGPNPAVPHIGAQCNFSAFTF